MEWLCWMLNASVSRMATWLWTVVWHHRPMLILGVKIWILQKSDNVYNCSSFIVGKEFSRGGAHGKTACMVQTARSLRVAISLTTCNSRTKLGATTTSLPFYSTRQPVVMVASGFLADQGSRFHLTPLLVISPYWPVTGSNSITLYVYILMYYLRLHLTAHFGARLNWNCHLLQDLKGILDSGNDLSFPDGLLINGQGTNGNRFTVDQGKLIE